MTRKAIRVRERRGNLHRVYTGVYAVGHANLSLAGKFVAAVKACGARARLSHLAALAMAELIDWDETWPIDITVSGVSNRRHPGLRVHRAQAVERRDLVIRRSIPVSAPWRAILESAAFLREGVLRRVVRQALADGGVSVSQLADVLARNRGRRGCRKLARVLAGAQPTRSELEDVVLDLIQEAGFAAPEVNRPLFREGQRVVPDFRWPAQRLTVEADSRKWHGDPLARADDAARQALLERHGDRVERVTWKQAVTQRRQTQERLAAAGAPLDPRRAAPERP